MHKLIATLKPIIFGFLATFSIYSVAFGQNPINGYQRMASPEHAWNVVVGILENGEVAQMLKYTPAHEPRGREYVSEAACRAAIDNDVDLQKTLDEVKDAVQKIATAHPEIKFETKVGCMEIDSEPQSF